MGARSVSFGDPAYLWLLAGPAFLLILWLLLILRRRADRHRHRMRHGGAIRQTYAVVGELGFWFSVILASSLCVVALARPRAVTSTSRRAADIVILQDGSASMYARDVAPDRWQRSVTFLKTFAETINWKTDRVGLALFAQLAAPQTRLTGDPNAFFFFLDHLGEHSPFRLEDNPTWDTNIEEGVYWGVKLVDEDERVLGKPTASRAFVVISDGQAWSGQVAKALASAKERGVQVYVVGVGTPAGALIPEPARPDGTNPPATIRAALDRGSLEVIARAGGGDYFELGRETDRDIAREIITRAKRSAPAIQFAQSYQELYWGFLLAAGVCLCAGALFLSGRTELWWQAVGALATVGLIASVIR